MNITAPYPNQASRCAKAPLDGLALRALRVRVRVGYVWRPCASAAVPASPAPLNSQSARSRCRANARVWPGAARKVELSPPPAQGRLLRRASALRASRPVLAAVPPVRPQGGSPKSKANRRLHALQGIEPPRSAQVSVSSLWPSRPGPAGAARPGRNHRRCQASPFSRSRGQRLREERRPCLRHAHRRNSRLRKKPPS